jgi:hypothetical protein
MMDYELWILIAAWGTRELWPFLAKVWFPAMYKGSGKREDALLRVVEDNTRAITTLTERMAARDQQGMNAIHALDDIRMDIAEVCRALSVQPPSRTRRRRAYDAAVIAPGDREPL